MAKQKGHRANKANDSFGTVNDDSLYRGKYRDEVYQDDDEDEVKALDPSQEEATPEEDPTFAKPKEGSDTDYKKRYDDLKRHYDAKLEEFKQEREDLLKAQQAGKDSGLNASELPKTPEELEKFKAKYPDVYAIVETVSSMQAEAKLENLKKEVDSLRGREKELEVQSAYKELMSAHPDFGELKTDEKFLAWLDQQPASIADGIYKNNKDAKWAIRVVDLYKLDTGNQGRKPKKTRDADPAAVVGKTATKDVVGEADPTSGKKMWKASEIGKLKAWQFEKFEKEIDAARAEGRIDYSR
jgi:hypothetical protein